MSDNSKNKKTTNNNPTDVNRSDERSLAAPPSVTPEPDSAKQASASATADNEMEDLKRAADSANAQAGAFLGRLEALKAENSKPPKKKRKRFALIHGVYSDEFVLPWESPAELEQLHQELKEEWQPIGHSQEEAVVDLTHWNWLKRRAMKMPQLALYRDPFSLGLLNSGKTNWHDIIDHLPKTCQVATDALYCTASALKALEALSGITSRLPYAKSSIDGGSPSDLGDQPNGRTLAWAVDGLVGSTKKIGKAVESWVEVVKENKNAFNQAYRLRRHRQTGENSGRYRSAYRQSARAHQRLEGIPTTRGIRGSQLRFPVLRSRRRPRRSRMPSTDRMKTRRKRWTNSPPRLLWV